MGRAGSGPGPHGSSAGTSSSTTESEPPSFPSFPLRSWSAGRMRSKGSPLEDVFRFIAREVEDGRPGHAEIVRRMSEVLFVQAIRYWADTAEHDQGVLATVGDPGLHRALASFHEDPAGEWTLDTLARRAAMSRTVFAERFRDRMGTTPHQYLTAWRMQLARRRLADTTQTLDRIAREVGYESGPSFSRAFKRETGLSPGAYRRTAAGAD